MTCIWFLSMVCYCQCIHVSPTLVNSWGMWRTWSSNLMTSFLWVFPKQVSVGQITATSGAGIMEADDRQVTTVLTVQPSFHHLHSTNRVSWSVTIVSERRGEVWLHIRRRDGNASWYSVCRVPVVEWRLDCEDCRHLTVIGLHDTGPRCRKRSVRLSFFYPFLTSFFGGMSCFILCCFLQGSSDLDMFAIISGLNLTLACKRCIHPPRRNVTPVWLD